MSAFDLTRRPALVTAAPPGLGPALARALAKRADDNKPIRIGVIGSGEMGTALVTPGMLMRGVELSAIATRRPPTALEAPASG